MLDAVHVVRAGFCPSTRMGKFAVPAVLGIALGLMRGEEPRHALLKREAEKNHKYSRLITVAQKQTKDKKRLHCPSFNSFIVSDYGDVSPAAIDLQEWLVTAYAKKCEREGARADGCNSTDMIRAFSQRFKLNVQLATASGLGGMLLTAGQPFGHDVL